MKPTPMKPTRFFFLFSVTLILLTLSMIAAAPHQDVPPVPVSLFDQIAGVVIAALIGFVAWLTAQVRTLKKEGVELIETRTPEDWHWLWYKLATTFVKAAYQGLESATGADKMAYVEKLMYSQLERYGFVVDKARKEEVRAIIEAAYFDFKDEFMDLEDPDLEHTETANSK